MKASVAWPVIWKAMHGSAVAGMALILFRGFDPAPYLRKVIQPFRTAGDDYLGQRGILFSLGRASSLQAGASGHGPLGVIKEGAYADILLVDGNPLADVSILGVNGKNIPLIMKDGRIYKNTLE